MNYKKKRKRANRIESVCLLHSQLDAERWYFRLNVKQAERIVRRVYKLSRVKVCEQNVSIPKMKDKSNLTAALVTLILSLYRSRRIYGMPCNSSVNSGKTSGDG